MIRRLPSRVIPFVTAAAGGRADVIVDEYFGGTMFGQHHRGDRFAPVGAARQEVDADAECAKQRYQD